MEPSVTDSYPVSLFVCSAECNKQVCSGIYVQKAFQCNGTIGTIASCSLPGNQKIRLYQMSEVDDSQMHTLKELTKDMTTVTLNITYSAGDSIVYHINQNYQSE